MTQVSLASQQIQRYQNIDFHESSGNGNGVSDVAAYDRNKLHQIAYDARAKRGKRMSRQQKQLESVCMPSNKAALALLNRKRKRFSLMMKSQNFSARQKTSRKLCALRLGSCYV
jgi:hypothetical protein